MVRPLGLEDSGGPLDDGTGGGDVRPLAIEYSELARLCLDCWLPGLEDAGSGGFSRCAEDIARRRGPRISTGLAVTRVSCIRRGAEKIDGSSMNL